MFSRRDKAATLQAAQRILHRRFRKAGVCCEFLQAGAVFLAILPARLTPEKQIKHKRRGRAVVVDEIAHQRVDYVSVDR